MNGCRFPLPHLTESSNFRGITILEIMLALVILGGCLAILGEMSRNGLSSARAARDLMQAELLCESVLAKVRLEIIKREPAFDVPISNSMLMTDEVPDTHAADVSDTGGSLWVYSLEINEIDEYGLIEIAVTVRQNLPEERRPIACRLVRWMSLEPEKEEDTTAVE